jgi:hypothetical protein
LSHLSYGDLVYGFTDVVEATNCKSKTTIVKLKGT